MLLRMPQPYDFALSTARFRDYGSDRATVWHEGGFYRVIVGREVRIEAAPEGVLMDPASPDTAGEVGRMLGLPFDLDSFRRFALQQPVLAAIVSALPGFRPTLNPRPFEALVIAITAQQISLRAAAAIRSRFVERFGVRHELAWEFPSRDVVARLRPTRLTELGFSLRKAEYTIGLARSDLDLDSLGLLPDADVVAALTTLPGLGRWTADWFLARHLARPEAWPAGDLGVRKALAAFYADGRPVTTEEARILGERFAPFQNLSANFLLAGARMAG